MVQEQDATNTAGPQRCSDYWYEKEPQWSRLFRPCVIGTRCGKLGPFEFVDGRSMCDLLAVTSKGIDSDVVLSSHKTGTLQHHQ
jgi:hypothetical protein